ncbi:MerC domain-containing protein [Woeseiaceae bacterium]|jgi:hypothetical protein|nr:MerC domain-containing protein [Woeseiaceae bacterium]MDB2544131.1 MerC domain-containing protein [Woeseiaceae bacterium]|tara:strand:+ start:608 stop:1006 length:399 start_codon:yes stop_codon:yes gene_type:complete
MHKINHKTKKLDNLSIWLSGLCILHCLALSIITISIPLFGEFFGRHYHAIMLFVIIPISLVALYRGYRNHKNTPITCLGCFGILMILFGGTIIHNQYSLLADSLFTISGSLALSLAHYYNNRISHYHSVSCQ